MNYQTIIHQFNTQGLAQQSLLTFQQLQHTLDILIRINTLQSVPTFNHQICQQLWGQCQKNPNGQIQVGQFATVLLQAKQILEQRIHQTHTKLKIKNSERQALQGQIVQARNRGDAAQSDRLRQTLQDLELELSILEEDYRNYDTDFKVITVPFVKNAVVNRGTLSPDEARQINGRLDNSRRRESQFFMKRSSAALTLMFCLAVVLLLVEIAITVQKHHFLGILAALSILAIFALNFFNSPYIKVVLGVVITSVVSDIVWLAFSFGSYWSPGAITTLPRLYPGLLKLVLLGVIIVAFMKVLVTLVLFSYINAQDEGTVNCGCCEITVFPQSGPFGREERPDSFFDPNMG